MTLPIGSKIHIIGFGGSGMSALGTLLLEGGYRVSGSDLKDSAVLDRLRALGATVMIGHDASHVVGADLVAYSTAIRPGNSELSEARRLGLPTLNRADLLLEVIGDERVVAISGTHGKTTTTSMTALAFNAAGLDPSYLIGGELNEAGTSARRGSGGLFVVEADESDGTFLRLKTTLGVLTNVETDHLDYYGTVDALQGAFRRFLAGSEIPPVVCFDDPGARLAAEGVAVSSYGTSDDARFRIRNLALSPTLTTFELFDRSKRLGEVHLPVPGIHNVRNATAAIAAAVAVDAPFERAADALSRFVGVVRRFQHRRVLRGVRFIDDYAHLPTEIAASIAAARQLVPNRVVVAFQPHRYSRTRELHRELGRALGGADLAVVTSIYAAGEDPIPGVSGSLVAEGAREILGDRVVYVGHRAELAEVVALQLHPGDLCITMGAGDITLLEAEISEIWSE